MITKIVLSRTPAEKNRLNSSVGVAYFETLRQVLEAVDRISRNGRKKDETARKAAETDACGKRK
jgi:hypothetical protein